MSVSFLHGSKLADLQDDIIVKLREDKFNIDTLSQQELKYLNPKTHNLWVAMSINMAPNNLAVRHMALREIFLSRTTNQLRKASDDEYVPRMQKRSQVIMKMIGDLSEDVFKWDSNPSTPMLWAEGYSYWLYTREVLQMVCKLEDSWIGDYRNLRKIVDKIDDGFTMLSIQAHGKWRPPVFGDCKDIVTKPLNSSLLGTLISAGNTKFMDCLLVDIIAHDGYFEMASKPHRVHGNTHTQGKFEVSYISTHDMSEEITFKFYEGYDKKYKTRFHEWVDIIKRMIGK